MSCTSKHRLLGTKGKLVRCIPLKPLKYRKEKHIMGVVIFIAGLMIGGAVGVFAMCLFQINKGEKDE